MLPVPDGGEDLKYVTVNTNVEVAPAAVLNALSRARLLNIRGPQDGGFGGGLPALEPLFGQPGSVTFEDTNSLGKQSRVPADRLMYGSGH